MTLVWPDDPDIRRAVAAWGQLLDETLLADGSGATAGLEWPDDAAVAHTLTEWGGWADRVLDEATARAAFGPDAGEPAMAWLEATAGWDPSAPALPGAAALSAVLDSSVDLVGLVSAGGGTARKHKTVLPGEAPTITGWTVRVATEPAPARPARHQAAAHRWGLWASVAAAVAAVALVGGTRPAARSDGRGQAVSVALGPSGSVSSPSPPSGGGGANGSSGTAAPTGLVGAGPSSGAAANGGNGANGANGLASGGKSGPGGVAARPTLPHDSSAGISQSAQAQGNSPTASVGTHPVAGSTPGATAVSCPTTSTTAPPPTPAGGQLVDGAPLTSSTTIGLPTAGTPGAGVVATANPPAGGKAGGGVSAGPTGTGTATSGTRNPGSPSAASTPAPCPSK